MKIQNREELERQDAFGIGAPPQRRLCPVFYRAFLPEAPDGAGGLAGVGGQRHL